jgi:mannonate dehydratase
MERREFAKTLMTGALGAAAGAVATRGIHSAEAAVPSAARTQAKKPVLIKVGCQSRNDTSQASLEFLARHGVYHMNPGSMTGKTLADIKRQQDEASKYGITIMAYHLTLSSGAITQENIDAPKAQILLGRPGRDKAIEQIQNEIRIAGQAGVQRLMYNMTILGVTRSGRTPDPKRGNASYSTWNQADAYARGLDKEPTVAGTVGIDTLYERITYFLDRVLPVAEEYKVRLGNHIADPPLPVGYRGITRWNSPDVVAGIRRYSALSKSQSHGFHLCLGSTAEGLKDPAKEILGVVDYLASRNQIVNVHMRNIKGGLGHFQEVYVDNGDMNFIEVMRALHRHGYDGMVMPDHIPQHAAAGASDQGFAFAYGYFHAILRMLQMENA